ncbi:MAG: tetraacyldisaccharide 4'-kinase [Desulfovibrionaceae bacterium]
MSARVTALQRSLSPLLRPLGAVYRRVMRLRAAFYRSGVLRTWKPPAFTVAVGNIGWGGSGKTPLVSWLLGWAEARGVRAAVLTRGYRARPKTRPYLVRPGAMAEEAGDEPLMLALEHAQASVLVDPARSRAGRFAAEKLHPGLYVLDDGFQHLAVARDMNLVLLTPEDIGPGWGRVIPSGSWREGEDALARADAFLIKAPKQLFLDLAGQLRARLGRYNKPVFSFSIRPRGVRRVADNLRRDDLDHQRYVLFSGVGEPGQVEATVTRFLGYGPEAHRTFRDHHFYTKTDVAALELAARERGCKVILCTPKDAVKLGSMASELFWTLDLDLSFGPSLAPAGAAPAPFPEWWDSRFDTLHLKRYGELPPRRRGARRAGEGHLVDPSDDPFAGDDGLGLFGEGAPATAKASTAKATPATGAETTSPATTAKEPSSGQESEKSEG